MILIAYENGEANFNGVNVRNRIKYLKLRRFLANRFINKSKRIVTEIATIVLNQNKDE